MRLTDPGDRPDQAGRHAPSRWVSIGEAAHRVVVVANLLRQAPIGRMPTTPSRATRGGDRRRRR